MKSKWKTTLIGVVGSVLMILNIVMPETFSSESNSIITGSINAIVTAVLSLIAIFSAKDELNNDNIV